MNASPVRVRHLGVQQYTATLAAMRAFTEARNAATVDEIWLTQHAPVFTQGQAGKSIHLLAPGAIPVVHTDRGGQVTYHGPGQLLGYLMFDLKRMGLSVRDLVDGIEQALIDALASYGIEALARADARGVYVAGAKIGALGLRVKKGRSYHGLALNVDMDLEPFQRINPCGLIGMTVTQVADHGGPSDVQVVGNDVVRNLALRFGLKIAHDTSDSWGRASA